MLHQYIFLVLNLKDHSQITIEEASVHPHTCPEILVESAHVPSGTSLVTSACQCMCCG